MTDNLMDRYLELAEMQNIDSAEYAVEWHKLAADAEGGARPALAEMCRQRGDHYAAQDYGEYIRLIEGSFSELIDVYALS